MRQVKDVLRLESPLSDQEAVKYSRQYAAAHRELKSLQAEKKEYLARIKSNMATAEKEIEELSVIVDTNRAFREVECDVVYDFDRNKKIWKRCDSGLVVKETDIPDDECNEELPLPDEEHDSAVDETDETFSDNEDEQEGVDYDEQ